MRSPSWPGLGPDELDGLSADTLAVRRPDRYRGTGQEARLADLDPRDRDTVTALYGHLKGLYECWRTAHRDPDWAAVARHALDLAEANLIGRVREVGAHDDPSDARPASDPVLRGVLHDLRGGAATAVLAEVELLEPGLRAALERGRAGPEGLDTVVLLCRDQAKIMRNALVDLDPEERARDTVENPHHLEDLVARWADVDYRTFDGRIHVRAEADASAVLSSCCLEVGAIDRIVYNLVNNAARHASDGEVALQARVRPGLVRFAVTNRVAGDQEAWLTRALADDPGVLFRSGVTRGGTGVGLGIVADFVVAAFGLPSPSRALAGGYLGATRLDDRLAVWFHWPSYEGAR